LRPYPAPGLLAGAFVLAAASFLLFASDVVLYIIAAGVSLLAVCAVVDYVLLRRDERFLSVAVEMAGSAVRGDTVDVSVRVTNGTSRTVRIRVRPELPHQGEPNYRVFDGVMAPRRPYSATFSMSAPVRGDYAIPAVHLRVEGPLRLVRQNVAFPTDVNCRVYPDIRRVREYIVTRRMRDTTAPHLRTARIRGLGSEFESLREYEEGDDIRRIDWKATAKHRSPIVRNYEIEPYRNIQVIVDAGRLMTAGVGEGTKFDHALDAALMACGVALDGGDRAGLMLFDDSVRAFVPPRGGLGQLKTLVELVYNEQPSYRESYFQRAFVHLQTKLSKRSMILILSDVLDVEASGSLLAGVLALSRRHLVVFAALRTPEVEAVIDTPSTAVEDPPRKAVAYRLLKERTQAMARMQKGGVQVIDVRPEDLTIPLVNKYIQLREMNLL